MSLSNRARAAIVACFCVVSVSVLGQALPPGVTPGMLDQLKSMSPAQRKLWQDSTVFHCPLWVLPASTVGLATPGSTANACGNDSG